MDTKDIQKRIYQNKVNKGFNVTNVEMEFCLLHGELAELLQIDLGEEIEKKMQINARREYVNIDGVNVRVSDESDCPRIHSMKLKASPFEKIASGRKTVELRLYDEKRRKINIGNKIVFTRFEDPEQKMEVVVKALHRYASFEDLFRNISPEKCGNNRSETPEEAAAGMLKYYSEDQIKKYGVLGIEIERSDMDPVMEVNEEQKGSEFERLFPDGMK